MIVNRFLLPLFKGEERWGWGVWGGGGKEQDDLDQGMHLLA